MPRVAFVHDWLTGMRGGEKCLERFILQFPDCEIFTLFHRRGSTSPNIEARPIHTSRLQRFPGWPRYYRHLLPLFPSAVNWNFDGFDLVISLSHCVAKGAIAPAGVQHVCYCFTPMRYAWHLREQYFGAQLSIKSQLRNRILTRLQNWDRNTSDRVDHYIAISDTVAQRIHDSYSRESEVVFPPVDTDFYQPIHRPREDFYLVVSALAPYKRIDLAIDACRRLGKKLVVIGTGQDATQLAKKNCDNVQMLGWQTNEVIRDHMRRCRALLFPGEEDFGIVPLEAQACGAPVIAFGRGGATETVIGLDDGNRPPSGVFFGEQTVESLTEAIHLFERRRADFDSMALRRHALAFSVERFDHRIAEVVGRLMLRQPALSRAA